MKCPTCQGTKGVIDDDGLWWTCEGCGDEWLIEALEDEDQ